MNGDTAERMLASGLVAPFPATAEQLKMFDPDDLDQLRNSQGELAGLPVVIQTQWPASTANACQIRPAP